MRMLRLLLNLDAVFEFMDVEEGGLIFIMGYPWFMDNSFYFIVI